MQGGGDEKCLWIAKTLLSGSGYHLYVFAFEQTALEKFHFSLVTIPFMFFCYHFFLVLSEQREHQEPPVPLCPSSHSHLPVSFSHREHLPVSVINMGPSNWLRVSHKLHYAQHFSLKVDAFFTWGFLWASWDHMWHSVWMCEWEGVGTHLFICFSKGYRTPRIRKKLEPVLRFPPTLLHLLI